MRGSKRTTLFEKATLSAAVCLGLLVTASNAQALLLNAAAEVTVDGITTPAVPDSSIDGTVVTAYASDYFGTTGGASSGGAGNANGWMFSRAGGSGAFSAQGSIQQVQTFTNTSGVDQNYFFDFTINRGSLSAYDYLGSELDYVEAGNRVSITLNGAAIFTSTATLQNDDSSVDTYLTTGGTVLGTYTPGSGYYGWGEYADRLDLGVFAAGDSFTLAYDIFTFAASDIAYPTQCEHGTVAAVLVGDGGELVGGEPVGDGVGEEEGPGGAVWCPSSSANSRFGDPNAISGMPISNVTVTGAPVVSVPEPGTLLLMGGGVLGLAFARRRRNRKS